MCKRKTAKKKVKTEKTEIETKPNLFSKQVRLI